MTQRFHSPSGKKSKPNPIGGCRVLLLLAAAACVNAIPRLSARLVVQPDTSDNRVDCFYWAEPGPERGNADIPDPSDDGHATVQLTNSTCWDYRRDPDFGGSNWNSIGPYSALLQYDASNPVCAYAGGWGGPLKNTCNGGGGGGGGGGNGGNGGNSENSFTLSVDGNANHGLWIDPDYARVPLGESKNYTSHDGEPCIYANQYSSVTWSINTTPAMVGFSSAGATAAAGSPALGAAQPGYYTVRADDTATSIYAAASHTVVKVESLTGGGETCTDANAASPPTIYVGLDEEITFTATADPPGPFPLGEPDWGLAGPTASPATITAGGDGNAQTTVKFTTPTTDINNPTIVKVRCGPDDVWKSIEVVVCYVELDIKRLNGGTVPERKEAFKGSITSLVAPGKSAAGLKISLPTHELQPAAAASGFKYRFVKVAPTSSTGKIALLKNNSHFLTVNETGTEADKVLTHTDLSSSFKLVAKADEGAKAGTIDLALIAYDSDGLEICRDTVRVFVIATTPKDGDIVVVCNSAGLDAEGYIAHRTVSAGFDAAASEGNVVIATGTYSETALAVPQNTLIVGLGGSFATADPYNFQYTELPTVTGGKGDAVFILADYTSGTTVLACMKITRGLSSRGGGIRIINTTANVNVTKNDIFGNFTTLNGYGAGVYVEDSEWALIKANRITDNTARIGGGGVFVQDSRRVFIVANSISNNEAIRYGGGIGCRGTETGKDVTIRENAIEYNTASAVGGGIGICGLNDDTYALIAASAIDGVRGTRKGIPCTVEDNRIVGNEVLGGSEEERGGGIYNGSNKSVLTLKDNNILFNLVDGDGSGVSVMNWASVNSSNNDISYNGPSGDDGGGVSHGAQTTGYWEGNAVDFNEAVNNGGGLHASVRSSVIIKDNSFSGNSNASSARGGGLYIRNSTLTSQGGNTISENSVVGHGGGIAVHTEWDGVGTTGNSELILRNNDTLEKNEATGHGGAIWVDDTAFAFNVAVDIQGATFKGNTANWTVDSIKTSGIYLRNNQTYQIEGNTFQAHTQGAAFTGVKLEDDEIMRDNVFIANKVGINLSESDVVIQENEFVENTYCHITVVAANEIKIWSNEFICGGHTPYGIRIDKSDYGSNLEIHENNFRGHNQVAGSYSVFIRNPTIGPLGGWSFVDAENNWWNSSGGAHDPPAMGLDGDYNTNLPGDRVWDAVDYKPYAATSF